MTINIIKWIFKKNMQKIQKNAVKNGRGNPPPAVKNVECYRILPISLR